MSAPVFVDTAALIALISRDDAWHVRTRDVFSRLAREHQPLLTSSAVIFELLDGAAARGAMRPAAMRMIQSIRNSRQWAVIHVSEAHVRKGEDVYASRMDKAWSLTDCTNMEIAREHSVTEVLSSDSDFVQAGFTVLLRE